MKKFFVMLALAWGTVGAFAQNEADSVAAVNNAVTTGQGKCILKKRRTETSITV